MEERAKRNVLEAPMAVYEMHLGSWMRVPEDGNRSLTYRELAPKLAAYVQAMGFTHVEFLPIMEHPLVLLLGLPDHRLLRPDTALWDADGFYVSH